MAYSNYVELDNEKIIKFAKKKREEADYSQSYIAQVLNIHQNYYSRKENGIGTFTYEQINKIAKIYDMNGLEFINFAHNYDPNKTNADDNFILKKKEKFIKDISKIRKDIMDKIKECIEELKKLEP